MVKNFKIGVVIPSYRVRGSILTVLNKIGSSVDKIYVVDDACPEQSGVYAADNFNDSRLKVVFHDINQGVGGATISGYRQAIYDDMDIVVKIDGDNQMDPEDIDNFINPIILGRADYTKGNRFYFIESIGDMPKYRVLGNLILSFTNKVSSGYWDIFDPTNGYTAIHTKILKNIQLNKISKSYFFESDMLFRLNLINAKVIDIPMKSKYGSEKSNLRVKKILFEFILKNLKNLFKRVLYKYYIRDFNIGSIELLLGLVMLVFSLVFGIVNWRLSVSLNIPSSAGTVMLSALPGLIGFQLLLSFLNFDTRRISGGAIYTLIK